MDFAFIGNEGMRMHEYLQELCSQRLNDVASDIRLA